MRASGNDRSLCEEARQYYYELLCHDEGAVPQAVVRHVEGCPFCREQIRRLRDAFFPAGGPTPAADDGTAGETIETLNRHFEFLGENVRCSHARPFLPELLTSRPLIRVPTPITVHIENCPQCAEDLASLRALDLADEQLRRLGRFYDESARYKPSTCRQAGSAAAALVGFALDETDPEALDHVSRCAKCRDRVYHERARASLHLRAEPARDGVLLCSEVTTVDLFDFVMPFGLDAAAIARADGRRDAVATHVRACPDCREKVQSLHRTIYAIAERADSATYTIYQCRDESEDGGEQSPYRYPVNVQVLQDEPAGRSVFSGPQPRVRLPLKAVVSAVAVVLVALIALNTRTASGTNVNGLVQALERTGNVHMASWREDNPRQPIQEIWMSRDLKLVVDRTGPGYVIYDLKESQKTFIDPGGVRTRDLSPKEADSCASLMSNFVRGIFHAVRGEDDFSPVAGAAPSGVPGQPVVYELAKETRTGAGEGISHRWRVSIDPVQQRPLRIEYRLQDSAEFPQEPARITTFEYPDTSEMKDRIKALMQPE